MKKKEEQMSNTLMTSLQPTTVDPVLYRKLYADVAQMTDAEVTAHYINFGRDEGRLANQREVDAALVDFDPKVYVALNKDLAGKSDEDLKTHYLIYGRNEGRKIALDVDLTFSESEFEYVRRVDVGKVNKYIDVFFKNITKRAHDHLVKDKKGIIKTDMAEFLIIQIEKTNRKLTLDEKRYLFDFGFKYLVDVLYAGGDLFFEQYSKFREVARRDLRLFDNLYTTVTDKLYAGCCCKCCYV